jgi:acyl-coenzyme A synthetase/AMP-(fatty) acid ligase
MTGRLVGAARGRTVDCVPVAATDPLYILYTSGTTGLPKGVVRDNGGHMVALKWSMKNVYDVEPGEVYWSASDVGWVVGHSYIVYAPLLHGATTILFEGKPVGTPDAGTFWRVIAEHKVKSLFTAPTAFRAIKKEDPKASSSPNTICRTSAPCSSPASGPTPTPSSGPSALDRAGHRPLVADRDRLGDRRQPHGAGAAAGEIRLAHRRHAGL